MNNFLKDARFAGIEPLEKKVWLASPTMHGDELRYMTEAYETNWMSTVGANIDAVEEELARRVGVKHAVALGTGTAALHLAVKLAAQHLYGSSSGVSTPDGMGLGGALHGRRVFCTDMTFAATVNPVVYEGGEPVFIDTERDTWNMDPIALETAFHLYPEVRLVVAAHLYGTPGRIDELRAICRRHDALLIEDAAESLGATYKGRQTGSFGDFNAISFNGNKIITGSCGGMYLTDSAEDANRCRKWSTQSREAAPWYQHEELGYNYRMSNMVAGVIRGQLPYLDEHIAQKRAIYERYREGLRGLPVSVNPYDAVNSAPNHWLTCLLIEPEGMCPTQRSENEATYTHEAGKSCPTEILEALAAFNAEGRPIWKPMHMQPIFRMNPFVTAEGSGRAGSNAYIAGAVDDVGSDIFERGLCLPSDNKMTPEQQDRIIAVIRACFR